MKEALAKTAAAGEKEYTYADYCRLLEGAPYQLIGGELVRTPAPSTYHQIIPMKLERMSLSGFSIPRARWPKQRRALFRTF